MNENVFNINDIMMQTKPTITETTPDQIMKTFETVFSTIEKFQNKANKFSSLYGRPPVNKQELKSGRPLVAIDSYSRATQELKIRNEKMQDQEKKRIEQTNEPKEFTEAQLMGIKINDQKLNQIMDNTFSSLVNMAEPYNDLTVKEAINKITQLKSLFMPKLKENIKKAIQEVLSYE